MPIPLQSLHLDRPGVPRLDPALSCELPRLLEPLDPPFDLTGAARALHNVHAGLVELKASVPSTKNARLNELILATLSAAAALGAPCKPASVTLSPSVTMWDCAAVLTVEEPGSKLLKGIGAIYFLVSQGHSGPSQAELSVLLQAAISSNAAFSELHAAHETAAVIACHRWVVKASLQLQAGAYSRVSAAADMVEAKVEKAWAGAYRFDLPVKTDGLPSARGLTPTDVSEVAGAVRAGAEAGSGRQLVAALGHWLGVPPNSLLAIRVFAPGAGLLRIDSSSSFAIVRLGGVLTELARAAFPGVLTGTDDLVLPLPIWLSRLLRALRTAAPGALTLTDLPGLKLDSHELRLAFGELSLPRRITPAKFVVDRAQPLIARQIDPLLCAMVCIDFALVHKVAAAYPHITQSEFLDALRQRSQLIHWGDLSPVPVSTNGYLSKVTPDLKAVAGLGHKLARELNDAFPGNHAGTERVLAHHNAFIRFTAFMLAVGLLLRGQETHLLPAAALLLKVLQGFNDKATPNTRAPRPEVCFGRHLLHQLRYLKAHYLALADRLDDHAKTSPEYANEARMLRRIASGADDLPLLVTIHGREVQKYSHLDLVADLGEAWVGKADAIRHAAPDILRAAGFGYESREAILRHAGGAKPLVANSSAWTLEDWYTECGSMQEVLFSALDLVPTGGLIRSLPRSA